MVHTKFIDNICCVFIIKDSSSRWCPLTQKESNTTKGQCYYYWNRNNIKLRSISFLDDPVFTYSFSYFFIQMLANVVQLMHDFTLALDYSRYLFQMKMYLGSVWYQGMETQKCNGKNKVMQWTITFHCYVWLALI